MNLLRSFIRPFNLVQVANFSKKTFRKQKLRDENIFHVVSPDSSTNPQAFAFGFCATGALGIERLLTPEGNVLLSGKYHPAHVGYFPKNHLKPLDVACGFGFTIYICKSSPGRYSVYGCGLNSDGQLGQQSKSLKGTLSNGVSVNVIPEPVQLNFTTNKPDHPYRPSHIACGRAHSLVAFKPSLESDTGAYELFSFGNNAFGQCGREVIPGEIFSEETALITRICLPDDVNTIEQIICGQDHSLLISGDGTVYSCGLGSDGQTGLGNLDSTDRFRPVKGPLEGLRVKQLASRGDTVLALTDDNQLFAWGNNEYGQIWPIQDDLQICEPVKLPLDEDIIVPPESYLKPQDVEIGQIKSIACAGSMCALLNEFGHVFVWGFGCIGLGPKVNTASRPTLVPPGLFAPALAGQPSRLVNLTSGLHHFVAQSADGLLWAWGAPRGCLYCLGLGKQTPIKDQNQSYPAQISLAGRAFHVGCGVDHTIVLVKSFA